MANEYNEAGADVKHITQINNTQADLITNLDTCQWGIANDTNNLVLKDKDGNATVLSGYSLHENDSNTVALTVDASGNLCVGAHTTGSSKIDIEKSCTLAASTTLFEATNTNESGTFAGTIIDLSLKQRYSSVDYDLVKYGAYIKSMAASASDKDANAIISCLKDGVNALTTRIDELGNFYYHNTGTTLLDSDHLTAYGISSVYSSGTMLATWNGRDGFAYGDGYDLKAYLDTDTLIGYSYDALLYTTDPSPGVTSLEGQNHSQWKNNGVEILALQGNGLFCFSDGDCAHGITTYLPTNSGFGIKSSSSGGGFLYCASEGSSSALTLTGITTTECAGPSVLDIILGKKSGTGYTAFTGAGSQRLISVKNGSDRLLSFYDDGDLEIDGALLQAGIFAEIHCHDVSTAQSIPTGTTYTKMTCFTDNGASSKCTADVANDKITIAQPGFYRVCFSVSFTSGTNNVVWKFAAFLNGVEQNNVHVQTKLGTGADSQNVSVCAFIDITEAYDLDLRVRHDQAGSVDITPIYATLNCQFIGNT